MALKSGTEMIVGELNARNVQSFAPDNFLFGNPITNDPNGNATIRFTGASGSTLAGKGIESIQYHRLSLSSVFSDITTIKIAGGSTVHRILKQLTQATGIRITEADVNDDAIEYVGNLATVNLVSKPTSVSYYGTTTISIETKAIDLVTAVALRNVTWSGLIVSDEEFIREVSRTNGRWLDYRGIIFSAIEENTGAFNSRITLTGNPDYGYDGEVTVLFNRAEIATVIGEPGYASKTAYSGSLVAYVESRTPEVFNKLPKGDWVDVPVVYDGVSLLSQPVSITNQSYNYRGQFIYEFFPGNNTDYARVRGSYMMVAYLPTSSAQIRGAYMMVAYKET